MGVTISNLNLRLVAEETLRAVLGGVPILSRAARDYSGDITSGTSVTVPVVGTTTARTFTDTSTTYDPSALTVTGVEVRLRENYVRLPLNHVSLRNIATEESFVRALSRSASDALAQEAWNQVVALIARATFPTPFVSTAANFDATDLFTLATRQSSARIGRAERYAVLSPGWYAGVVSSNPVTAGTAGGTERALSTGVVPRIAGYDLLEISGITSPPGQSLVGWVASPDAIAFAARPLPLPEGFGAAIESSIATDPDTGFAVEFRRWLDPSTGQLNIWAGHGFGCALGSTPTDALIRIVSAADA